MMDRIIRAAENDRGYYRPMSNAARPAPAATIPDAISASMRLATDLLPIAAVVTYTNSGSSSLRASRERPATSILSMAASIATARRLTLAWGIHSVEVPAINSLDEMSAFACETALKEGFANEGRYHRRRCRNPHRGLGNNEHAQNSERLTAAKKETIVTAITGIAAREILDSRGNPTVEVDVDARRRLDWKGRSALGRIDGRSRSGRASRR